ncbi:hypothetical protein LOD99_2938 [Oopsacas minuta]|uniref:Uncharacterized protein n=1 Tax=Oopsacas minuta TaxID=111878 RepID=A0AAV7JYU3_9METZ|nr:hypothetical protein LOD99_2938 [Oopsacas minuta]
MSAISLSKLDRDLADNKISRDEYIEKCKYFFKRKREKYRDTYHKRKQKDNDEVSRGEEEILRLKEIREYLHTERFELNQEIIQYKHVIRRELMDVDTHFHTQKT